MWIASSLETIRTPTYIALGNFDGIHRGHRKVMEPILGLRSEVANAKCQADLERQLVGVVHQGFSAVSSADASAIIDVNGDRTTSPQISVVTFSPHPRAFFSGQPQQLLTPLDEKAEWLAALGIDQLVLLPFDQELANLTPPAFVEEILVGHLQAQFISVGQDFCFGRQRSGTSQDLRAIAAQFGIPTHIVSLQYDEGERISSSAIRQALQDGHPEYAAQLLGRPYSLIGEVVTGQQLGRTIGFPTANLRVPSDKFLPRQGVYGVWVHLAEVAEPLLGVMNLGQRPTVDGTRQTIEVHVLNWAGDLYGQRLRVDLAMFIRPEQRFTGIDALKAQIHQDCETARERLLQSYPLSD